jgi:hypothetical protein
VTVDEFSERLDGVRRTGRGLSARCPAHDDRQNSLSLATGDDGRVLVNCFAQCRPQSIVRALGLELRDLFADARPRPSSRPASTLDAARHEILHEARRQLRRLPLDQYAWSDELRGCYRIVDRARALATRLGPRMRRPGRSSLKRPGSRRRRGPRRPRHDRART